MRCGGRLGMPGEGDGEDVAPGAELYDMGLAGVLGGGYVAAPVAPAGL